MEAIFDLPTDLMTVSSYLGFSFNECVSHMSVCAFQEDEEPPSLLCDSDLLGSVREQLEHSTINLSDLT